MKTPRFNDLSHAMGQLKNQLSSIDDEIDRAENDARRAQEDVKVKTRALKVAVKDALESCDEFQQTLTQVQRETSHAIERDVERQAYSGVGLNPSQLAWELTNVITRYFQQIQGNPATNSPQRPTAQT